MDGRKVLKDLTEVEKELLATRSTGLNNYSKILALERICRLRQLKEIKLKVKKPNDTKNDQRFLFDIDSDMVRNLHYKPDIVSFKAKADRIMKSLETRKEIEIMRQD